MKVVQNNTLKMEKKEKILDSMDQEFVPLTNPLNETDIPSVSDSGQNSFVMSTMNQKDENATELRAHDGNIETSSSCSSSKTPFDFQNQLKYHDLESYVTQRDHKIGTGLFNTDELEDLPPRYQKKVLKAYDQLKAEKQRMIEDVKKMAAAIGQNIKLPNHFVTSDLFEDNSRSQKELAKSSSDATYSFPSRREQLNSSNETDRSPFSREKAPNYYNKDKRNTFSNRSGDPNLNKETSNSSCNRGGSKYSRELSSTNSLTSSEQRNSKYSNNSVYPSNHKDRVEPNDNLKDLDSAIVGFQVSEKNETRPRANLNQRNSFTAQSNVNQISEKEFSNSELKNKNYCSNNSVKYPTISKDSAKSTKLPKERFSDCIVNQSLNFYDDVPFKSTKNNDKIVSDKKSSSVSIGGKSSLKTRSDSERISNQNNKFDGSYSSPQRNKANSANTSDRGSRVIPQNKYSRNNERYLNNTQNKQTTESFSDDVPPMNSKEISHISPNDQRTEHKNSSQNVSNLRRTSNNTHAGFNIKNAPKIFSSTQNVTNRDSAASNIADKSEEMQNIHSKDYSKRLRGNDLKLLGESSNAIRNCSSSEFFEKRKTETNKRFNDSSSVSSDYNDRNFTPQRNSKYNGKHGTNKYTDNTSNISNSDFTNHSNLSRKSRESSLIHKRPFPSDKQYDLDAQKHLGNIDVPSGFENRKSNDCSSVSSDYNDRNFTKQRNSKYNGKHGTHKYSHNTSNVSNLDFTNDPNLSHRESSLTPKRPFPSDKQFDLDARKHSGNSDVHSEVLKSRFLRTDSSRLFSDADKIRSAEEEYTDLTGVPQVKDIGFFIHITVSENSSNLEMWQIFFKKLLKCDNFDVVTCCEFTESLILSFNTKENSLDAYKFLASSKRKNKDTQKPHIVSLSQVKKHLFKPCACKREIFENCFEYFKELSLKCVRQHKNKMEEVIDELKSLKSCKYNKFVKEHRLGLEDALVTLRDMESVFKKFVEEAKVKVKQIDTMSDLRKVKINFSRECNSFGRCLPIYSRKDVILETVRFNQVSVIIAETGSGKSTQLAEYLLQSMFADKGTIICTQPRKIAAISITQFVSGQIGSYVGKEVGYEVGIEKKYLPSTKIIYMTDYALLRKCLRNRRLKGVSCVIIDEAHERTLFTDLLLGLLKQCIPSRPDIRVVITSATIDPSVFVDYFSLPPNAVVNVPGRAYPVEVVWWKYDVDNTFKYVNESVKTAFRVHTRESRGDILVFLTSPAEIDEAILMFKEMCSNEDMPQLMSLHGKSDIQEQMLVFQANSDQTRRIIFATNSAETSLTIPGVKYVIDSGMTKEMLFYPEKNKSCLLPKLINKSSAEQRKGRAGRTQPGVCYRLYSKHNFENMPERSLPEILKTNLLSALLKVYEFGIKPESFDFVESPPKVAIMQSLDSLEMLELIKDNELTKLGRQVVQLSIEPRLAKFVLLGVECGIGHEAAIIAALVSEAGRLFLRFEDNKIIADQKKQIFCQKNGDLCTLLEVYKRWLEVARSERFDWCVANYISSKALLSAAKTVKEIIITLRLELAIPVSKRYNNLAFKTNFQRILFSSFSENLCIFSGHPKLGYFSPYFKESLFIHPSSSLKHLRIDCPKFLVYTTLMETSRNFILDVTPINEEILEKAYRAQTFQLNIDTMKKLQILPVILGPFGEKVLTRHILGKGGSIISNLESKFEKIIKTRNFHLDVCVDKGVIVVYVEEKFHKKISDSIYDVVQQARDEMAKEESVIKMEEGFSYFCMSSGGNIHDIIMPGEFRDITVDLVEKKQLEKIKSLLQSEGTIQSLNVCSLKNIKDKFCINATYKTVAEAQKALMTLNGKKINNVRVQNNIQVANKSTKPLYSIKLSWPRLLSKGTGWVRFASEEDCILASGELTRASIFIEQTCIYIRPSKYNSKDLDVKKLPYITDEKILREKLVQSLPDFLKDLIKEVHIDRVESQSVVESDIIKVRDQLLKLFCHFTPPSKICIDVVRPRPSTKTWEAWAYFECAEDGIQALQKLDGKIKLDSIPVQMTEVLESHICCKKYAYEVLKKDINYLVRQQNGKLITNADYSLRCQEDEIVIKFSCRTIEMLCTTRQRLLKLIQGRKIECFGNRKYFYLFTETGKSNLRKVQNITNTYIVLNPERKVIAIYGSNKNCYEAEAKIHSLITESKLSNTKVFDLKSSHMPSGFLKHLYTKYGLDLYELIRKFNLKAANIDVKAGTLIIEGQNLVLKQVEEHLESICVELYKKNPNKNAQDGDESCAICLDPVRFDFYRLESCGHAFCKSCLILQLESKVILVTCAHEDCGKEFLIIDIDKIISLGGENLRKVFQEAALQYHVRTNAGKVSYCPSPDCCSVYRVSEKSESEFHCPSCSNDICTHCQSYSHKGMSCDIFQKSKDDEDYSLKVWMLGDGSMRKTCPSCKSAIEKDEGCNHMECINCMAHFCWLCLEVFPSGPLVYDHLPFCPMNQRLTH